MRFYLKGYYGYKNLGDELLLLGVLQRLHTTVSSLEEIIIETKNPVRLKTRLTLHKSLLPYSWEIIKPTLPDNPYKYNISYFKLFGWGEALTFARPFPYNGRNYLLLFPKTVLSKEFWIIWGIGKPKGIFSKRLYRKLLWRAQKVVVRDQDSYLIAKEFAPHTELYQDFCYTLLELLEKKTLLPTFLIDLSQLIKQLSTTSTTTYVGNNSFSILESSTEIKATTITHPSKILINLNPYIWNHHTKDLITHLAHCYPQAEFRYIPWEIGADDTIYTELQQIFPKISYYDRTQYSFIQIYEFIQTFQLGIAARLHVLLLLKHAGIPFIALAYQDKVTKLLQPLVPLA